MASAIFLTAQTVFHPSEGRISLELLQQLLYRCSPIKNRARVPGPEWEPMTAPT